MFKKILVFLAINSAIAVLAALAPPSMTSGDDYLRVAVVEDFVENAEPGTHLNVLLGDSRSDCCVAARDIGFVNLSFQGASPVEGFYVLNQLLERGAIVDKLILSYGPFHIFTQDTFHAQGRFFGLMDQAYIDQVLAQARELNDREYLEYNWKALEVLDDSLPWVPDSLKFRIINVMSIDRTIESAWEDVHRRLSRSESEEEPIAIWERDLYTATPPDRLNNGTRSPESEKPDAVSPINELYLNKLVALAKEHDVDVNFLVMPFNRDVEHPGHDYYKRYYEILDNAGLKGCYGPGYWWANEYFGDEHHLNVAGTHKLQHELGKHLNFCSL